MAKVKLLVSLAGPGVNYVAKQEVTCSEDGISVEAGWRLVDRVQAVWVGKPPTRIQPTAAAAIAKAVAADASAAANAAAEAASEAADNAAAAAAEADAAVVADEEAALNAAAEAAG